MNLKSNSSTRNGITPVSTKQANTSFSLRKGPISSNNMKRQSTGLLLSPASPASKPSALNTPEAPIVFKTPQTGFFRLSNEVTTAPSTEDKEAIADMFQDYIIKNSVKVPVVRLDGARYLFGTKLVIASIING